jgi:glyoxylase-like metal-dependent hydrolase (beta-lactamase superfamily II)
VSIQRLDNGITCIDANYVRPGVACFYLLERQGQCAVIETGTSHSVDNLHRAMAELGLSAEQLHYVIPTHIHLDHAGGAGRIMSEFPAARLLVHPRGAVHMADPARLVASAMSVYGEDAFRAMYGDIQAIPAERIDALEDGASLTLGDSELVFRHTRGHANHHFCIWDAVSQGWFSGDMFGVSYPGFRYPGGDYVVPATTPTQFDPDDFCKSLALLHSYQPARMYLTHYGELAYSERLRDLLQRQVQAYARLALENAADPAALAEAVADCSVSEMAALNPDASPSELRDSLALDMQLNLQGLAVWLGRQVDREDRR